MLFGRSNRDVRRFKAQLDAPGDDQYVVAVHPERLLEIEPSGEYAEWELLSHGGRIGLFSLALNRQLAGCELPFELLPSRYELPVQSRRAGACLLDNFLQSGKTYFNDEKVRLLTDITLDSVTSTQTVRLEHTDYLSGLISGDATLKQVRSRRDGIVFDGISLVADEDDSLRAIADSDASNHVGCSSLAITADDRLVIVAQSATAAQYASQLMPSASGSASWSDLDGCTSFTGFLRRVMERELAEECGIPSKLIAHTQLIGYQRQLDRGGKPEFYGVSFLSCAFDELDANADVFTADIEGIDLAGAPLESLQEILDAFRDERQTSFSFSLYVNLAFLEHHLAEQPSAVNAWRSRLAR